MYLSRERTETVRGPSQVVRGMTQNQGPSPSIVGPKLTSVDRSGEVSRDQEALNQNSLHQRNAEVDLRSEITDQRRKTPTVYRVETPGEAGSPAGRHCRNGSL